MELAFQDGNTICRRRRQDDRNTYDDEEKFAILYLKIMRDDRWSDTLAHFHALFPPGALRRQRGKGLTQRYDERKIGGLECRYYRLRDEAGMDQLRSVSHSNARDRAALIRWRGSTALSTDFMGKLRSL